ncbi:uncharacterized protein L201_005027 [Kwoniella dendrophila CBS 6074]|uniref:MaoC-like domain-containing protein n=1 Tax=Kwoniella dendrophila CBS 6074 TaxID=1295534 RepID=A0AAX4JYY4_9TREE
MIFLIAGLTVILGIGYHLHSTVRGLFPLLESTNHVKIRFATRELTGGKVTILLIYHILRSAFRRINLITLGSKSELSISEVVETSNTSNNDGEIQYELDNVDLTLEIPFILHKDDLNQYIKCCLSPQTYHDSGGKKVVEDVINSSYHLNLLFSALTEPSILLLLSSIKCPIDPIGSVNVRNKFSIVKPLLLEEIMVQSLRSIGPETSISGLIVKSKLDKRVKKVKRGWEFRIIVELSKYGVVAYKQEFMFLQFHKHPYPPPSIPNQSETADNSISESVVIGRFSIGGKEPLNWAELSKDYNPIHTSNVAAKILGFKKKIAHGNHIVSKAIQAVSEHLREEPSIDPNTSTDTITWVEVEFKRPITVPALLEVKSSGKNQSKDITNKRYLEIWNNGKVATTMKCGTNSD